MIVFGINLSHDEGCAAVIGGEVRVAIENERLSRLKHNEGRSDFGQVMPFPAIRYCCETLGITPRDVDLWVVNSVHRSARGTFRSQALGIPDDRILDLGVPGHHLAHAYSAYYCSPFRDAAVVVLDTNGGYEYHKGTTEDRVGPRDTRRRQENYSIYVGRNGRLHEVHKDWLYPGEIGIGQLYMLYAAALQLTPRDRGYYGKDDALAAGGKLMGYAAWDRGRTPAPSLYPAQGTHLTVGVDDFLAWFERKGLIRRGTRRPGWETAWAHQLQRFVVFKERTRSLREERCIRIGGEAQRLLEQAILRIAEVARARTGLANVCFAGGNALNITALTEVMSQGIFEDIFTQPAANDAGNAVGAALYGYFRSGGRRRPYLLTPYSTSLGRSYPESAISAAIRKARRLGTFTARKLTTTRLRERALRQLAAGSVIAVCRGPSEFGPRALGHRSLLASAATRSMTVRLNKIKGREWYRPVAPVVCEEDFAKFFDGPIERIPFMTLAATVRRSARRLIPAACHVDGSARVQTVTRESDPFLHALLKAHARATGVPVLINTSFNFGGEPIVETPYDAMASYLRTEGVECLLIGSYYIEKVPVERRTKPSRSAGSSRRRKRKGPS